MSQSKRTRRKPVLRGFRWKPWSTGWITITLALMANGAVAGTETAIEVPRFHQRSLSGPRFGMTYLPGHGDLYRTIREEDMGRLVSQFGWHFEHRVVPDGGGPQFVIETVPLVAGVEYGKIIPHVTLAMGVRWPAGWEFGLGPDLMVLRREDAPDFLTSLVVGCGRTFDYGGVSIPLTLAYSTNPDGDRVSLMVGYAISKL